MRFGPVPYLAQLWSHAFFLMKKHLAQQEVSHDLSFTPHQMLQCTNLIYSKKYRKRAFHQCIIQAMSHYPWGQTVEIFGIELPTNGCCCEEHTICLVLYPTTGTKGMNGINRNMSKSKGWTLQSSLLTLWMEKTRVNNQTKIDDDENLVKTC